MYHLARSLYANFTRKEEYAVLILGLDNAGKTTLLERLKTEYSNTKGLAPDKIAPTVGQNVAHITKNGVMLKIWDLGGQEALRTLWESYYTEAHAVVFVVDSTDRTRIEQCRDALDKIVSSESIEGTPILMLANKQDQEDRLEVEDIKEIFNKIAEKMSARDSRVLPISALDGTGVEDATEWLVSRLVRNKQQRPPKLR
ncbi:Arf family GTPase ARL3 [Sugiyamaella lignohabitans]|uniref:Arf family GTPase ARL3 n=1 Tax=Sugiyamaella lignohabitans TaxID=796027 RepID=A0A167C1Z8_9ASCO|nr:Arf family GTPase ARL3 [Sugiyamaella lignohabitans]ANB11123.1 Arf family GTPase ARL3 [Sugiyamaella lignohabitans]